MKISQMKIRLFLTAISLIFTSLTLQTSQLAAEESLEDVMVDMDTLFKNLKRSFADPSKKDSNLVIIADFKSLVIKSATFTPKFISTMPESQRAAALLSYVNSIELLYAETSKLEFAIALGRPKEHLALLYNNILDIRDDGHAEFDPAPF